MPATAAPELDPAPAPGDESPDQAPAGPVAPVTAAVRPPGSGPGPLSLWGWAAILGVTILGGVLRFWRLDRPRFLVFDETYYVKQGWAMFKAGHELAWKGEGKVVDPDWNAGKVNVFLKTPEFVVHPPVGKWMIGFGEWIFGPTSTWGWRFSAAAVGTISILMIALIARRLFGSTVLGVTAGLLLAVDGVAFVHSRTSLLDVFVMFWALAGFGCLVVDRDDARHRLATRIAALQARGAPLGPFGPGLGLRWWRLTGAVCLGLCAGSKWSGIFFALAFGLMSLGWDMSARRAAGVRHWFIGSFVRDGLTSGLAMAPIAIGTYVASWAGWFLTDDGYDRQWAVAHPARTWLDGLMPDAVRSLWKYHNEMWWSNTHITSSHPYEANPWSWLVQGRPTAFSYVYLKQGKSGCTVADCVQAITPIGNPIIWWGATLAVPVLLFAWALRRDWRAGAVLAGLVGGYLPWFMYQYRTIFSFYSVAFVPWVVLALTYALGLMLGSSKPESEGGPSPARRRRGAIAASAVVLLAVLTFWFFLPLYTAQTLPWSAWGNRTWLKSWT